MAMVITISDTKTKIYIPVLPEKINYSGDAKFYEYDILNKGQVIQPSGKDLTKISWESFFPGEQIKDYPFVNKKNEYKATELHKKIESWRENGTKLKLNITGTPFNISVYIESYEASAQDAFGSIYYSIDFAEAVDVKVTVTKSKAISRASSTQGASSSSKTYTVKSGDCLWNIAKKLYGNGAQWTKIYEANKSTIESTAKSHGKKSSSNGHWIYPGSTFAIP